MMVPINMEQQTEGAPLEDHVEGKALLCRLSTRLALNKLRKNLDSTKGHLGFSYFEDFSK